MIIILTLININKSEVISVPGAPRIICLEVEVAIKSMGITMGKPSTAIRVELLSVLDEIAETMVKAEARPMIPIDKFRKNQKFRFPGFPRKTEKAIKVNTDKPSR
jgi:hypothetical protein